MTMIQSLMENYPVRKTKKQKENFRNWFAQQASAMGYEAAVEKQSFAKNVVVGDPETAEVTFTAHYDTPPVMPLPNFITPKNVLIYLLYQIVLMLFLLGIGAGISVLVGWLTKNAMLGALGCMLTCYIMIYLLMFGPANKTNANDNTSGVAAVMEIMSRLPEDQRQKAAFILFDNEEKGLLGSSAYASKHKKVCKNRLLINLDCVGDGEYMLFIANRKTRKLPSYELLQQIVMQQEGRTPLMEKMELCVYPSDQANFKLGMAVCACKKKKGIGYYMDKIHTRKDTVCEQANMDFLGESLSRFVANL